MLKIVLTPFFFSFFFIILAELALDTILLLRQLVFCTYTLFGTLKFKLRLWPSGYRVGLWIRQSWVPSTTIFFSVPDIFFNYNIHDIFFHPNVS